jgi:hypothetical protein
MQLRHRRTWRHVALAWRATKDQAVADGRETAARDSVEHIIKEQDGQIGEKNSHGNDPRNVPR